MCRAFLKLAISAAVMIVTVCGVVASEVDDNLLAQTASPINRRQSRGLVEMGQMFVPKGQWIVGSTASYSTHINSNYSFLIIENISSDGYTVGVSPIVAYAVKDNLTVGARFEYGRSLLRVDTANITIGDDDTGIEVAVNDIYSITQSYHGMATLRQYIPLGENKRFTLFTEFRLGVGGSVSKYAFDSPVQGTYAKSIDASISVVPGIVAFATNNVAFEVTVGALGASFSHIDQIQNQIYEGSVNSSQMSFMINLFSIGLGVAFYL